jgi:hypothetical protein
MKLFSCQNCSQMLYFENDHCEHCKKQLGYIPETATLAVVEPDGTERRAFAEPDQRYRFCDNAAFGACNWLIHAGSDATLCAACRHNRVVPDLSIEENVRRWRKIEFAKHRLFYTLMRLGLPLANRSDEPETGLAFDFLAETPSQSEPVMTGHDNGVITLNLAEADDGYREQLRQRMGEPYRTLLGHFRHEVGHYFWDVLVDRGGRLEAFRACFGDERPDYGEALKHYYAAGPAANWQENFVSAYASSHPWEDFAETWAHYLHIVDTLEMAGAFGMRIRPTIEVSAEAEAELDETAAEADDIHALIDAWLPVTFAVNSLNRCMGQPDLYPFVLSEPVIGKLGFIHGLVRGEIRKDSPPVSQAIASS